ncbi:MAG: tetratricopeptide repeat protein [Gemmatimonadetes bacterium]|nr:tetratricopeptide repeat protein [Gemmatimonadota bacterium]
MRPTAAAARCGVMAIATLILFLPSSVAVQAQDEIVARGNAAYQEGDFAAAVEAYEAVLESGYRSAGLEYNLANAYFKTGELGRAILHWERALELAPGDEDIQANLDLARSLTVDAVEPLPRFWLFSVMDWWIGLLPAGWLRGIVAVGWLAVSGGVILRVLGRAVWVPTVGRSLIAVGSLILLLFAPVMTIRETGLGLPEEAIILAGAVQVRSAPSAEDDLTLFEIHEGTKVRVDQRTAEWLEVVLEDGKVGWVPVGVLEVI